MMMVIIIYSTSCNVLGGGGTSVNVTACYVTSCVVTDCHATSCITLIANGTSCNLLSILLVWLVVYLDIPVRGVSLRRLFRSLF
jgi:hypothetical protein